MSNYSQTTFFAPKDALSTGDPDKKILGAELDPELSAISAAIATKIDTADTGLEKSSTTIRLSLTDLTAATPVSADQFVFADASDSQNEKKVTLSNLATAVFGEYGVTSSAAELNLLDGVTSTTAELNKLDGVGTLYHTGNVATLEGDVNHDNLVGFVSNEHVNHGNVDIIGGNGLSGGGAITSSRTIHMRTPATLTASTTNSAPNGAGHSHAIGGGIVKTDPGTGGQITVSTSGPSGSGHTNGDMWLQV